MWCLSGSAAARRSGGGAAAAAEVGAGEAAELHTIGCVMIFCTLVDDMLLRVRMQPGGFREQPGRPARASEKRQPDCRLGSSTKSGAATWQVP